MSNDLAALEERIAGRIDPLETRGLAISNSAGGMSFSNMSQVLEFAKIMAIGGVAIRKHLRGNPGTCLAVTIQAIEWRMSPFAVANKSYSVNDQLAYEAQLIHAVILMRAPLKGRPKFRFEGEGGTRKCIVWGVLDDGTDDTVEYVSPAFDKITPKNSPLWKADPDQQHGYYSVRAFARRHFPDVILGVYAVDEIEHDRGAPRDVTPARPTLGQALDRLSVSVDADEVELVEAAAAVKVEAEKPKRERRTRTTTREAAEAEKADQVEEASQTAQRSEPETASTEASSEPAATRASDATAQQDVAATPEEEDPFAEGDAGTSDADPADEAEAVFTRMENLDVAPRGIDQSDIEQCRMYLQGHDAAHAGHPRTVPAELKRRYVEEKDEKARVHGICWMKGHDSVTGYKPPPKNG
ncbi:recombinase RecT [Ancylobacter amanitiformis]|uniref:Recombinase RecT n=1 Tax=Ancylobacter amanitiformis TaxID=217069 RepID=A0ABU0LQE5_9HYPH|nr:recombinase RecT [Ancylobacter amanitiformis]MDQ0510935.1 hypothetical protein [Ancylobacter amanitiformis]